MAAIAAVDAAAAGLLLPPLALALAVPVAVPSAPPKPTFGLPSADEVDAEPAVPTPPAPRNSCRSSEDSFAAAADDDDGLGALSLGLGLARFCFRPIFSY